MKLKNHKKFSIKLIKIQIFFNYFFILFIFLFLADSKYENIVIRINALRVSGFKNKYLKKWKKSKDHNVAIFNYPANN